MSVVVAGAIDVNQMIWVRLIGMENQESLL
jgi:hypothetical protein